MDAHEIDFEFAKQFWTTANVVVSFSIAQIVAFGITAAAASADKTAGLDFQIQHNFVVAVIMSLLSAIGAVALVCFCQSAASAMISTLPPGDARTKYLKWFDFLRISASSVAGALSVLLVISIECPGGSCPRASNPTAQPVEHAGTTVDVTVTVSNNASTPIPKTPS